MINDDVIGTNDPTSSNENVATMLPVIGLNGEPLTKKIDSEEEMAVIDDKVEDLEDDSNILGFSESVYNYIENDDAEFDFEVREGVENSSKEYESEVPLSNEVKKIATTIGVLKAKVKSLKANKSEEDSKKAVIDTKREIVALTKRLNTLSFNANKEQKKAVKKLIKDSYKSAIKNIKEENKNKEEEVKESVSVEESVEIITEKTDDDKDKKELPSELKRLDMKRAKLENLKDDLDKAKKKFIETGDTSYEKRVKGLTYKIDKLKKEIESDEKKAEKLAKESSEDLLTEAANMENEIKPIVAKLNEKGYKVKYASPGHRKLRKKEDEKSDGIYYDKLYSDARIMFKDLYKFPDAPKYWHWREVDGCSYLDISPIPYDKKKGTPDEAFAKWKDNYMYNLKVYVDKLKDNNSKEVEESVIEESVDVFAESLMEDIFSRIGFDELEMVTESVEVEESVDHYDKILNEIDTFLS